MMLPPLGELTPTIVITLVLFISIRFLYPFLRYVIKVKKINKALSVFPSMERHWLYGSDAELDGFNSSYLETHLRRMIMAPRAYRKWEGPLHSALVLCHPETIKSMIQETNQKSWTYEILKPLIGEGLVTSAGEKWLRHRRLLTPAFHFEVLRSYHKTTTEACNVFMAKIDKLAEEKESVFIFQHASLLFVDIFLQCALSYNTDCQLPGRRMAHVDAIYETTRLWSRRLGNILYALLPFTYKFSADGQRFKQLCDQIHKSADSIITQRQNLLEAKGDVILTKKRLDFLDILLTAKDDEGKGMAKEDIIAEVDTFLGAGHHTTASSLSWTLYLLAKHQNSQKEIQDEIDEMLEGKNPHEIDWSAVSQVPSITRCLKESQRLYPPIPIIARKLSSDVTIDGHLVPEGTTVDIPIWALHHNPTVWGDDHMEFKPERFTFVNASQRDPFAFLPFASGPRNCIGKNFAITELKVILAKLLHRYTFTLPDKHKPPVLTVFVALVPEDDIPLKVNLRST